ncbi:hypothetical protein ACFYM2_18245 [Streptomyces sp. NPDC006711]|uniref:hypothetical protein n=1 Tax=Streptomyces sp. NPDC006711 TaxID=3364762 RepID=UPI00367691DB
MYEVELGVQPVLLAAKLPSDVDSFEFDTLFDFTWQVVDPERFVVSQERDVPALLHRLVQRLVRPVTRKFPSASSADAEACVQQLLDASTDLAAAQGLRLAGTVQLRRDADARAHQGRLRTARYDAAAALPEHDAAALKLRQEQDLRAQKIAFYRHHLAEGGLSSLLLHLSQHAEDTQLVVDSLRDRDIKRIENQLQLINRVLPDEALEQYQLEEPQQLVLALFRSLLADGGPAAPPPAVPLRKLAGTSKPGSQGGKP